LLALSRQMLTADDHRGRAKTVLREDPTCHGTGFGNDEDQVVAIPGLDLRGRRAEGNSRDWQQLIGRGRRVVDRHCSD